MTVTIVCDVLGDANNGTTIAAMNLIRSLRENGHTVRVLCPDADKVGLKDYYIVPTYNLGPLNGYVRKNGVTLAKRDDAVIKMAIDGADIVHIMVPFSLGRRAAVLAKRAGIPVSAGFHAMAENLTTHFFMKNNRLANRITYKYYSGLYKNCDAIHYPTQFLRQLYEGMYGPTNGYVISNGVNSQFRSRPVEKPAEYRDKFVVVFTGRYSKEKSHKLLIDAAALSLYSDRLQLVFAGSGPLREKLEKQSKKLPIPPVFCFYSRDQMTELLNYADLYIHPAEVEAEGIACLEAISCGLVPVISDSPRCATKAYALDEKNLFHYDDPKSLTERIDWWLSHPKERAERGQAYTAYAKDRFDEDACMDKMEAMLLETIERAAR